MRGCFVCMYVWKLCVYVCIVFVFLCCMYVAWYLRMYVMSESDAMYVCVSSMYVCSAMLRYVMYVCMLCMYVWFYVCK